MRLGGDGAAVAECRSECRQAHLYIHDAVSVTWQMLYMHRREGWPWSMSHGTFTCSRLSRNQQANQR